MWNGKICFTPALTTNPPSFLLPPPWFFDSHDSRHSGPSPSPHDSPHNSRTDNQNDNRNDSCHNNHPDHHQDCPPFSECSSYDQLPTTTFAGKYAFALAPDMPEDHHCLPMTKLLKKLSHPGCILLSKATIPGCDNELCFTLCTEKAHWSGCHGYFHHSNPKPCPCDHIHINLDNTSPWAHETQVWTDVTAWLQLPFTTQAICPATTLHAIPAFHSHFP